MCIRLSGNNASYTYPAFWLGIVWKDGRVFGPNAADCVLAIGLFGPDVHLVAQVVRPVGARGLTNADARVQNCHEFHAASLHLCNVGWETTESKEII
jgi:hypothetical protein